jgi:hypothetical protein
MDPRPIEFLDGPCICVDHILRLNAAQNIAEFVEREGAVTVTQGRGLRLALADKPHGVRVFKSARVGLTLKGYSADKEQYIMRNYRYLTNPRETKKGKQLLIVALRRGGYQQPDIVSTTGSPKASVEKCTAAYEAGTKSKDTQRLRGTSLGTEDTCILYGFAAAHDLV